MSGSASTASSVLPSRMTGTSSGKRRNASGNKSASAVLGDANKTEQRHRTRVMAVNGTKVAEVGMGRGTITVVASGTMMIVGDMTVAAVATVGMMIEEPTAETMT